MKLYAGFDLHSRSSHLAVLDQNGKKVFKAKLANDMQTMTLALEPYRERLAAIAVESTFNWYWLVDALMEAGYQVRLANPAAIQKYKGLKHSDDSSDAQWLAEMLRLGILPQGYIYPREHRPVRDLLRKRMHLVKLRTSLINSLENIIARNAGVSLPAKKIKQLTCDHVAPLLDEDDDLALCGQVSKEAIDYLTRQIIKVEKVVDKESPIEARIHASKDYSGSGDHSVVNDYAGDRPHRSLSPSRQLCFLLPKGSYTVVERGQRKRKGKQEKR